MQVAEQPAGGGDVGLGRRNAVATEHGKAVNAAKRAIVNELPGSVESGVEAALEADLQRPSGAVHERHHLAGFLEVNCHRLFGEGRDTSLTAALDDGRVRPGWGGDGRGLDALEGVFERCG